MNCKENLLGKQQRNSRAEILVSVVTGLSEEVSREGRLDWGETPPSSCSLHSLQSKDLGQDGGLVSSGSPWSEFLVSIVP